MPSNLFYSDGSRVTFTKHGEKQFTQMIEDFTQADIDRKNSYIQLEGQFVSDGSFAVKRVPIVYSYDKEYRNRQMAKLYRLNDWYNSLPACQRVVTMMTLTTHQRDFPNYYMQYDFIRDSWLKLKDIMKKKDELGNFEYLLVAEPHKSGFVHYHILIFKWITDEQASRYKQIWHERYAAGSSSKGIDISVNKSGALRSVKNYLMKYLAKTFTMDYNETADTRGYFPDSDLKRFRLPSGEEKTFAKLSTEVKGYFLKVFHAVKWSMNKRDSDYKGFRAFQPSRGLSKIMALPRKENTSVIWNTISLVIWGVSHPIRTIESSLDLDDLPKKRPALGGHSLT